MPQIDGLPAADPLQGSEPFAMMQGGKTKSATPDQLLEFFRTKISLDGSGSEVPGPTLVGVQMNAQGHLIFTRSDGETLDLPPASASGIGFTLRGAWAASTNYALGDLVSYQGSSYAALIAFTSTSTFNLSNWQLIAAAATPVPAPPHLVSYAVDGSGNLIFTLSDGSTLSPIPPPGGGTTTPTYATSFSVSAPSTMTSGSASTVTFSPVGGVWHGQTITPAATGISGTFAPTSAVGSGTTALSFQFTPSASGSGSINATASPSLTSGGAQNVTVGTVAPTLSVTGITLSPATGTANSAAGTVIGTLTATTNTGAALTNPAWTLLSSAGGDFQIVSGNQVAVLPSNVPAGSYSLSVQIASGNASTFSQPVAVTITAAMASVPPLTMSNATYADRGDGSNKKMLTGGTGSGSVTIPTDGGGVVVKGFIRTATSDTSDNSTRVFQIVSTDGQVLGASFANRCPSVFSSGGIGYDGNQSFTDGAIHELALDVTSGGYANAYIDGNKVVSRNDTVFNTLGPCTLSVGSLPASVAGLFDVRVYSGTMAAPGPLLYECQLDGNGTASGSGSTSPSTGSGTGSSGGGTTAPSGGSTGSTPTTSGAYTIQSVSGIPTSQQALNPFQGVIIFSGAPLLYVCLFTAGADEGVRQAFGGGQLPFFAAQNSAGGNYTVRGYDASTGGNLIYESPVITVTANPYKVGGTTKATWQQYPFNTTASNNGNAVYNDGYIPCDQPLSAGSIYLSTSNTIPPDQPGGTNCGHAGQVDGNNTRLYIPGYVQVTATGTIYIWAIVTSALDGTVSRLLSPYTITVS